MLTMKKRHAHTHYTHWSECVSYYFVTATRIPWPTTQIGRRKRNIFIFDNFILFSVAYFPLLALLLLLRVFLFVEHATNRRTGSLITISVDWCVVSGYIYTHTLFLIRCLNQSAYTYLSFVFSFNIIPLSLSVFCSNFTHSFIISFLFRLLLQLRLLCSVTTLLFISYVP